jgi:hypothetical protein
LPFLQQTKINWQLTPQWAQVKARSDSEAASEDSYALVLNAQLPNDFPVEVLKRYPLSTYIVRLIHRKE